jgi:hypothetical protein
MKIDDWIYVVGVTVGGLAFLAMLLALTRDWLRGVRKPPRHRCPRCWYNMEATPGLRCSECGREARSERHLAKSRRRWRVAVAAFVVLLVAGAAVWQSGRDPYGWIRWTPTPVLIHLADMDSRLFDPGLSMKPFSEFVPETTADFAAIEVADRYAQGKLSLAQRRSIARKTFRLLSPIDIESRGRWPAGVDLYIMANARYVSPFGAEMVVVLPAGQTLRLATEPFQTNLYYWRDAPPGTLVNIGSWPLGTREIPLEVTVKERGNEIWSGTMPFKVRVDAQMDDLIDPVRDPLASEAIARLISSGLSVSPDGAWLTLDLQEGARAEAEELESDPRRQALSDLIATAFSASSGPPQPNPSPEQEKGDGSKGDETASPIEDVTLGLRFEFIEDDRVVARASVAFTPFPKEDLSQSSWSRRRSSPVAYVPIFGDTDRLSKCLSQPGWEVRIVGDGATALRAFAATAYWDGEVRLPLAGLMEK